jgi:ATP-dependent DNA helicase RecG
MISDDGLRSLINDIEADNVERTVSSDNTDKFGEAICSFANDLADRRKTGVLVVGIHDNGTCGNLNISDQLLQRLASFRTDGSILPPPLLTVSKRTIDGCAIAVVEVEPSTFPPLKIQG